jgi:hypothetical protein
MHGFFLQANIYLLVQAKFAYACLVKKANIYSPNQKGLVLVLPKYGGERDVI